jgi:hypothetical protein
VVLRVKAEVLTPHRNKIHGVYLLACVLLRCLHLHHHVCVGKTTEQWVQRLSNLKVHRAWSAENTRGVQSAESVCSKR